MHTIEKRPSGFVLTFQGFVSPRELSEWATQSRTIMERSNKKQFGIIIDLRRLVRLQPEADTIIAHVRASYRDLGIRRAAIVLDNTLLTARFRRTAEELGTDTWEKYINVTTTPNWSAVAVEWVRDGREPPIDFH